MRDQPFNRVTLLRNARSEYCKEKSLECNQAFYHATAGLRKPYGDVNGMLNFGTAKPLECRLCMKDLSAVAEVLYNVMRL
jgi:hypothetical protein